MKYEIQKEHKSYKMRSKIPVRITDARGWLRNSKIKMYSIRTYDSFVIRANGYCFSGTSLYPAIPEGPQ